LRSFFASVDLIAMAFAVGKDLFRDPPRGADDVS
jgi:hypothetical protein